MNKFVENFMDNIKTKDVGFYVGAGSFVITLVGFITYTCVAFNQTFSGYAVLALALALVAYLGFTAFKVTSVFGPIALVAGNFFAITAMAGLATTQNYFSTAFFNGFSLGGLFGLNVGIILPLFTTIIAGIAAIVASFMSQNKKVEVTLSGGKA